jgi:hypothetical protein
VNARTNEEECEPKKYDAKNKILARKQIWGVKTFFMMGTSNFHDGLHNYIMKTVNFHGGVYRTFTKYNFVMGFESPSSKIINFVTVWSCLSRK